MKGIPAFAAALLLAACNMSPGGGTDVGNPELTARVSGSLKRLDGSPAAFIPLHLRPKAFFQNPDALPGEAGKGFQDGFSDTQGFFTFDSVPKGEYRVEAMAGDSHGAAVDIVADGTGDRLEVGALILDSTGSITGRINYVRPIKVGYPKIIIAVYGSDRWTAATTDGRFTLSDLPPGAYRLHVSANTDSDTTFTVDYPETRVLAGERDSVETLDLGG